MALFTSDQGQCHRQLRHCFPSGLLPSDCRDKTDAKEHAASIAYWLIVSAGRVERPGSDDRCPYSQGLADYVASTSIVNSQHNRLPVITYMLAVLSLYLWLNQVLKR
jgi:hypothetical protein